MKKVLDKLRKLWYDNQAVSKEKPHTQKQVKKFFKKLLKKYLTNAGKCGKIIEHSSGGHGFTE